ncbi:response regulator [candidate division KSB1 bacterium]|nr:MAG: response regulator [candidate division KSB1 bacterium]
MAKQVLLIEDDPDIRMLVEMILRMSGIDVVSCAEGGNGLKALETARFDLVILDVMMPDMSGYEVLKQITGRYGDQAPPVALFTARPEDTMAKELAGQSAVHVLPKPFEPADLARTVQSLMRN